MAAGDAPQQQPWTSAGIARSGTTRGGATNGSTDAPCQTADRVTAHSLIASVARSFPPLGGGGGGGGTGTGRSTRRASESPYLSRVWTSNASASPRTAMTKFAMTWGLVDGEGLPCSTSVSTTRLGGTPARLAAAHVKTSSASSAPTPARVMSSV